MSSGITKMISSRSAGMRGNVIIGLCATGGRRNISPSSSPGLFFFQVAPARIAFTSQKPKRAIFRTMRDDL